MDKIESITGSDQLTSIFGYWPSFHDAEVLWMRLDRLGHGDDDFGPTIEVQIHTFEITDEVGEDGRFVLRHHVLVHLQFREAGNLRLDGFNHQNAIMGLRLTNLKHTQMERVIWDVCFDSANGVAASFQCGSIEVLAVIPCEKCGTVTGK